MIEQTSHRDDAPLATSKERKAAAEAADQLDLPQGDTLLARAVTINRGVSEVFACFRDFANLATFMENVERIEVINSQRSHWVVKAPGGRTVEWDAVITGEAADSFIAWASAAGADVAHSGRVDFRDAGERGTVVTITLLYDPPAGAIGRFVAMLFQREPGIQARRDLRRFKQLMETGEIATAAKHQYSACDNGLPADNQDIAQELYGQPMSGLFGYSHMTGGYAGGQAEYVRVPFSDVGPIVIPDGIDDEKVLFLSDILPTGWMAAENAEIAPGDIVEGFRARKRTKTLQVRPAGGSQ